MLKKSFNKTSLLCGAILGVALSSQIHAAGIGVDTVAGLAIDVGNLDTFTDATLLASNGDAVEAAWVSSVVGSPINFIKRSEDGDPEFDPMNWQPVENADGDPIFSHSVSTNAEYFLIKTGAHNAPENFRDFLYENITDLGWAVVNLDDIAAAVGAPAGSMELDRISHISEFGPNPVPIPIPFAMFAAALFGFGFLRKKANTTS